MLYVHERNLPDMTKLTVKARSRHGTRSLDLTIPVKIVKEMNIHEGDIFVVEASVNSNHQAVLSYIRIFRQKVVS